MTTITEDYVSFETAKLLKEKGFDEPCVYVYRHDGSEDIWDADKEVIACQKPTLQMAMKWLRDVHNFHIMIDCIGAENYMPTIQFTRNGKDIVVKSKISKLGGNGFDTCEQACEASIVYCLENLI